MANEWVFIIILLIAVIILFLRYSDLKGKVEDRSIELFDNWKQKELNQIKSQFEMQSKQAIQDTENMRIELQKQTEQTKIQLEEQSKKNAQLLLEEWRQNEEGRIRKDAINKSKSVIIGKVTEYLVPFFPGFKYNPKDVRFIGTPIDVIIFDGLDEGNIRQIVFGEIKTGKYGYLTSREKSIKNIVDKKNVKYEIIHIETEKNDIDVHIDNSQKMIQEDDILKVPHIESGEDIKKI